MLTPSDVIIPLWSESFGLCNDLYVANCQLQWSCCIRSHVSQVRCLSWHTPGTDRRVRQMDFVMYRSISSTLPASLETPESGKTAGRNVCISTDSTEGLYNPRQNVSCQPEGTVLDAVSSLFQWLQVMFCSPSNYLTSSGSAEGGRRLY